MIKAQEIKFKKKKKLKDENIKNGIKNKKKNLKN